MTPRRDDRPPLTLGTAGHIDHGKTALISVLTGKNTDRLPEERSRGISIELGYASLTLPDGRRLSVVDVPGHERFVRTMVAGASGVDMFLLCVAADDGVMPQTREHLAVLRQLGVERGVVAVTKSDVGEPELAAEEAAELVPGAPVVCVSSVERTGTDELLRALAGVAAELPGRAAAGGGVRLHVDRSFTLRGIGTVVTGTLWSGQVAAGDHVRILPRGLEARVRSVQVHDSAVERAEAGQRVALNLGGVGWREGRARGRRGRSGDGAAAGLPARRGRAARAGGAAAAGQRPAARASRHARRARARGAARGRAAIRSGGFRAAAARGASDGRARDRLILRQVAPPDTIGGGVVVDAAPRRHGARPEVVERLRALARGEEVPARAKPLRLQRPEAGEAEPLDDAALLLAALLRADGEAPRADADLAAAAGLSQRDADDRLRRLVRAGQAVRVARNLHFHRDPLAALEARAIAICERDGSATIAGVRDELGTTRKYAQALLEHLDRTKVTRRDGDAHVLRRRRG
jgi:selenocysteine-specific elongation factor